MEIHRIRSPHEFDVFLGFPRLHVFLCENHAKWKNTCWQPACLTLGEIMCSRKTSRHHILEIYIILYIIRNLKPSLFPIYFLNIFPHVPKHFPMVLPHFPSHFDGFPRAELRCLDLAEETAARRSHICAAAEFLSADYQGVKLKTKGFDVWDFDESLIL